MADDTKQFNATSYFAYIKDEKKLMGIRCRNCSHLSSTPRPMCPSCHSKVRLGLDLFGFIDPYTDQQE